MFKVGDIVSYPMHGVGVVESIEKREVRGVEDMYYVLCFRTDGLKVLLPLDRAVEAGLRHIISAQEAEEVIAFITQCEVDEQSSNWNRRYRFNLDRLKTNDVKSIAQVVKSLSARSSEKGLSSGEKNMLNNARNFLVDELAAATGRSEEEMTALLKGLLED
ncbi:MAG: CarD family transcriptional regulator [Christensenellales bacterium]